ncbi:hypothetical protein VCUG_01846, partial [Vavraia culicis subsp. floridensis]
EGYRSGKDGENEQKYVQSNNTNEKKSAFANAPRQVKKDDTTKKRKDVQRVDDIEYEEKCLVESGDIKRIKKNDEEQHDGMHKQGVNEKRKDEQKVNEQEKSEILHEQDKSALLSALVLNVINQKITKHRAREVLEMNNLTVKEYNSTIKGLLHAKIHCQNRMNNLFTGQSLRTEELLDNTFLKEVLDSKTDTYSVTDKECYISTFYQTRKILGKKELLSVFAEKCNDERISYDAKDVHVLERALHFHLRRVMESMNDTKE